MARKIDDGFATMTANILRVGDAIPYGKARDRGDFELISCQIAQHRREADKAIARWHRRPGYRTRIHARRLSVEGLKIPVFVALAWRKTGKVETAEEAVAIITGRKAGDGLDDLRRLLP